MKNVYIFSKLKNQNYETLPLEFIMISSSKRKRNYHQAYVGMSSEVGGDGGGGRRGLELQLLDLVFGFVRMSGNYSIAGSGEVMKKDCCDLIRRIALLVHLAVEISLEGLKQSPCCLDCVWEVVGAIQAAKRLVHDVSAPFTNGATKNLVQQFQYVTTRLEIALSNLPYNHFYVSDEVQEQVCLVRAQLRRASNKYESMSKPAEKRLQSQDSIKWMVKNDVKSMSSVEDLEEESMHRLRNRDDGTSFDSGELMNLNSCLDECSSVVHSDMEEVLAIKSQNEVVKSDEFEIPENFLCPISFELMIDPVIVSTGQTYERSNIQSWINRGNTYPKSQEQLQAPTLTPNFLMKKMIHEWCEEHNVKPEKGLTNRKLRKYKSLENGYEKTLPIKTLVRHLSLGSVKEQKAAVTEIRKLSKSSQDHRVEIAEAGAIPHLINLLTSKDVLTQENAISCILNLSLHEQNKRLVMLSDAISYISEVLKFGSMEGRECAAATIFSLSLEDDNREKIGASGVIPNLLEILEIGSPRGQKDAAGALLNLCMYQGNKDRAFKAGIVKPLLRIISDSNGSLVDEALCIMLILCGHLEAKAAMANVDSLLVLTEILKTGSAPSKGNAAAVLLALCEGDWEKLEWLTRLGTGIPLMELAEGSSGRTRRKAVSLLEQLRKP